MGVIMTTTTTTPMTGTVAVGTVPTPPRPSSSGLSTAPDDVRQRVQLLFDLLTHPSSALIEFYCPRGHFLLQADLSGVQPGSRVRWRAHCHKCRYDALVDCVL